MASDLNYTPTPRERVRFWAKVKTCEEGCWEWQAAKSHAGYGVFSNKSGCKGAHRFSYLMNCGPIPDGLHVLHKCDNPSCVRPDHLEVGTPLKNMVDAAKRNRTTNGERSSLAKLTADQVREIMVLKSSGTSAKSIAKKYGVHWDTIHAIFRGNSWNHITGIPRKRTPGRLKRKYT